MAGGVAASNRAAVVSGLILVCVAGLIDHLLSRAAITRRIGLEQATAAELDRRLLDAIIRTPTLDDLANARTSELVERLSNRERVDLTGSAFGALVLTVGAAAQFAVTAALLGAVHPVLLLLPLTTAPALWMGRFVQRADERGQDAARLPMKTADALAAAFASPAGGFTARTGDWSVYLAARCRQLWQTGFLVRRRTEWRMVVWHVAGTLASGLAITAALIWTASAVSSGRTSIGQLVVVIALAAQLGSALTGLVGQVARARRLLHVAADLAEVLRGAAVHEPVGGPASDASRGAPLVLDSVWYRYPGRPEPAVRSTSLVIPAGSVVALVGENGAGKSTLVGLITGLLRASGRISRGELRLTDQTRARWQQGIVAVTQEHGRFEFSVAESIALRDYTAADEPIIAEAARRGAFAPVLRSLPLGSATQLGVAWPGGVDLSSGQWQKLAISRGFARDPEWLYVMDEPTAALDPESEAELFASFRLETAAARAMGTIAVFVTHRLTSSVHADLVVMVADGKVVDAGPPELLMQRQGPYRELILVQQAGYAR